jgi:hypothetical protein
MKSHLCHSTKEFHLSKLTTTLPPPKSPYPQHKTPTSPESPFPWSQCRKHPLNSQIGEQPQSLNHPRYILPYPPWTYDRHTSQQPRHHNPIGRRQNPRPSLATEADRSSRHRFRHPLRVILKRCN